MANLRRLTLAGEISGGNRAHGPGRAPVSLLAVALMLVSLTSCTSAAQFRPADLSKITLGASDTPLGLRYAPDESGFRTREEVIDHMKEAAKLDRNEVKIVAEKGGIRAGHVAWFFPARVVSGKAELRPPMPMFEVALTLYENEWVAIREFGGVGTDLPESFPPVRRISAADLGEESYAVADERNARSGFWYLAWRRGNLMLQVAADGPFETSAIMESAKQVDSRAAALE